MSRILRAVIVTLQAPGIKKMEKASDNEQLHILRSSTTNLYRQLSCQLVIINQIFVRPIDQQALRLYLLRNLHKAGLHIDSGSLLLL